MTGDLGDYRIQYCSDHPLLEILRHRHGWNYDRDRVLWTHHSVTKTRMDALIEHMNRNSNGRFEAVKVDQ